MSGIKRALAEASKTGVWLVDQLFRNVFQEGHKHLAT